MNKIFLKLITANVVLISSFMNSEFTEISRTFLQAVKVGHDNF
jgi:hypothetical protein